MFALPPLESVVSHAQEAGVAPEKDRRDFRLEPGDAQSIVFGRDSQYSTVRPLCQAIDKELRERRSVRSVGESCSRDLQGCHGNGQSPKGNPPHARKSFDRLPVFGDGGPLGAATRDDLIKALGAGVDYQKLSALRSARSCSPLYLSWTRPNPCQSCNFSSITIQPR